MLINSGSVKIFLFPVKLLIAGLRQLSILRVMYSLRVSPAVRWEILGVHLL